MVLRHLRIASRIDSICSAVLLMSVSLVAVAEGDAVGSLVIGDCCTLGALVHRDDLCYHHCGVLSLVMCVGCCARWLLVIAAPTLPPALVLHRACSGSIPSSVPPAARSSRCPACHELSGSVGSIMSPQRRQTCGSMSRHLARALVEDRPPHLAATILDSLDSLSGTSKSSPCSPPTVGLEA